MGLAPVLRALPLLLLLLLLLVAALESLEDLLMGVLLLELEAEDEAEDEEATVLLGEAGGRLELPLEEGLSESSESLLLLLSEELLS